MKILITGQNSYTGTNLANHLLAHGHKIKFLSLHGQDWENENFSEFDSIFHAAGIAHDDAKKINDSSKDLYFAINSNLAYNTALKAKREGVKQFIYMSSAIIYGESAPIGREKIITRETMPSPASYYGESKLQAENLLIPLNDENFRVCILRCPMIYGKLCKGNYPVLAKLAQKLPVFPKINNTRSMLYIKNFAEFVRLIITNQERGIFWPQNNEYSNTSELVKLIANSHRKKILLLPGFEWALKILARKIKLVNKAFGSLAYSQDLSVYKENYRLYTLEQSINETEL